MTRIISTPVPESHVTCPCGTVTGYFPADIVHSQRCKSGAEVRSDGATYVRDWEAWNYVRCDVCGAEVAT